MRILTIAMALLWLWVGVTHACGPSPTVTHFPNVGPQSTAGPVQNGDTTCTAAANASAFPETTPLNTNDGTGWNTNNQIWTTPAYYYSNAGNGGFLPNADFAAVNGNYTGSTQGIIRWVACKWGIDEDWAYAESSQESGWIAPCAQAHGGTTCADGGDCNNPDGPANGLTANLSVTLNGHAFTVTNSSAQFVGVNGIGGAQTNGTLCPAGVGTGVWASYGIIQNKINAYEWYVWPMGAISTAFSEDHRWAKWRGCMNGDMAGFFSNPADYTNAVSRARSSPNVAVPAGQTGPTNLFTNETNLQYLALGCLAAHFSGRWYDSGASSYATSFVNTYLNPKNWPGGRG